MTLPLWLIVIVSIALFVLALAAITSAAAWYGMALENQKLRARLCVVQIDLTGLDAVRPRRGRFHLEDHA